MISSTRVIEDLQHQIITEQLHNTILKFDIEKEQILKMFKEDEPGDAYERLNLLGNTLFIYIDIIPVEKAMLCGKVEFKNETD